MSLRFPYTRVPTTNPVWPLGGRLDRPKAIIQVSIVGPAATLARRGLLDTGADDTAFPDALATLLGIDLTAAPTGQLVGVGGASVSVRYAQVELRLTDGIEFLSWRSWVAITSVPLRFPLLGFAGFLQFFDALFCGASEEVILTTNSLYPGT
jgi:hypothetical protein